MLKNKEEAEACNLNLIANFLTLVTQAMITRPTVSAEQIIRVRKMLLTEE